MAHVGVFFCGRLLFSTAVANRLCYVPYLLLTELDRSPRAANRKQRGAAGEVGYFDYFDLEN